MYILRASTKLLRDIVLLMAAFEPLRDATLTGIYVGCLDLLPHCRSSGGEFIGIPSLLACAVPARLRHAILSIWITSLSFNADSFLPCIAIDAQLARLVRAHPGL